MLMGTTVIVGLLECCDKVRGNSSMIHLRSRTDSAWTSLHIVVVHSLLPFIGRIWGERVADKIVVAVSASTAVGGLGMLGVIVSVTMSSWQKSGRIYVCHGEFPVLFVGLAFACPDY